MQVELYAAMLLAIRIVSTTMLLDVIRKQVILKKRPIKDTEAYKFRERMYGNSFIILLMNAYPIWLDVKTITGVTSRPDIIQIESVLYMLSFSIGVLVLTMNHWLVYRNALK